jgi:hypothetical protein
MNAKLHKLQLYQLQATQMHRFSYIYYLFFGDQAPQRSILFRTWKLVLGIISIADIGRILSLNHLSHNVSEMCVFAYLKVLSSEMDPAKIRLIR